jgi:hypothetical protein
MKYLVVTLVIVVVLWLLLGHRPSSPARTAACICRPPTR